MLMCYILSIRNKSSNFYQVNKLILKESTIQHINSGSEMPVNPYLGVKISNDLKRNVHIDNICNKVSWDLSEETSRTTQFRLREQHTTNDNPKYFQRTNNKFRIIVYLNLLCTHDKCCMLNCLLHGFQK